MQKKWVFWGILVLIVLAPFIHSAAFNTATTLFVWNVPAGTRSYSITYGAACNASAFYFNEIDANFDPDNDGNAAKVPPTANLVSDNNVLGIDYNYEGIPSPSSGPSYAFYSIDSLGGTPTTTTEVTTEFTTDDYINSTSHDGAFAQSIVTSVSDVYTAAQFQFGISPATARVKSLKFYYAANAFNKTNVLPCENSTTGSETDMFIYFYNFKEGAFRLKHTRNEQQSTPATATIGQASLTIDTNASDYISSDRNVIVMFSMGPSSTPNDCIIIDEIDLNVSYYPDSNVFCQTQSIAPITITNNGQADLNIDGNFSAAFNSTDANLVLKVWQGTGSGCGAYGMGGWEKDCSVTNALTDLGMSTCRQYNQTNATNNGRLITRLQANDSNQLCFSGDINTFTRRGTYVKTFQVSDFNT